MATHYYWIVETVEDGETVDVERFDTLKEAAAFANEGNNIALVKGMEDDRLWSYVDIDAGTFPVMMEDAFGRLTAKVPAKYIREFNRSTLATS